MGAPSLTYTLTNGQTADASQVMQNFNDLLNGYTDGTKNLSVSALTVAGALTANGAINLGDSSADLITCTGSYASTVPVNSSAAYDLGGSTLGWRSLYIGSNSQTVRLVGSGSMSATWTLTLPVTAGSANYFLQTNGSGVSSWSNTFASPVLSGGVTFSTTAFTITADTSDGSDTKGLTINGGGGNDTSRGALMQLFGNEATTYGGRVYIQAGNVTNALTTNPAIILQSGSGSTVAQSTGAGAWTLGIRNTASYPGQAIAGCTDASSATGGDVGEYIESTQTSLTSVATTAVYSDIGNVVLSAGDWDVEVACVFSLNSAVMSSGEFGIGTGVGSSGAGLAYGTTDIAVIPPTATALSGGSITARKSISTSTTYYGKVYATYTGGPPQYRGMIRARRVR